jgi:glutathione S-transferase
MQKPLPIDLKSEKLMSLKLLGVPLSNYFNMVKHSLMHKGLDFEEVNTRPSQEADFLAKSPMGKVPVLETAHGCLTETDAILDYLEETYPQKPLFPTDPFARAKVRQLMKTQELYVEGPAHELIMAIFGGEVPEHVKANSQPAARKGLAAIGRLVKFSPWIAGEALTYADVLVFYSFTLSNRLTGMVYGWDMLQEIPGLAAWYEKFGALEVTQKVMADNKAASEKLANRIK